MNRDAVASDLTARGYTGFVLLGDPRSQTNVVVLAQSRNGWVTYIQDERAQLLTPSVREFAGEDDALADFVHRVEVWNRLTSVR
ncbi:hypothetical protein ET475_09115 [Microbacterium protaetiae]|uniref:Uncharacterized protein n=1 Tax=Microbacterium protaetiae TaxID=2509458 RepID=A0A4P6EFE9_9MICO|nr:hypothetical protein [Microbacterium protaetiae]QAY60133.1 hypothetical protein ET475_09115 [Microbacterium protaetiae]